MPDSELIPSPDSPSPSEQDDARARADALTQRINRPEPPELEGTAVRARREPVTDSDDGYGDDDGDGRDDGYDPGEEYEDGEQAEAPAPDLVFTTKVKDRTDSDVGKLLRFTIDGERFEATKPKDDAFVFLTTAAARSTPMGERMAAIIQFVDHALTEESGIRVRDRLLDRDDDFGFEDLLDILQKIVKHWTRGKKPNPARYRNARRRGRR
jgi:hypothetical protein